MIGPRTVLITIGVARRRFTNSANPVIRARATVALLRAGKKVELAKAIFRDCLTPAGWPIEAAINIYENHFKNFPLNQEQIAEIRLYKERDCSPIREQSMGSLKERLMSRPISEIPVEVELED